MAEIIIEVKTETLDNLRDAFEIQRPKGIGTWAEFLALIFDIGVGMFGVSVFDALTKEMDDKVNKERGKA